VMTKKKGKANQMKVAQAMRIVKALSPDRQIPEIQVTQRKRAKTKKREGNTKRKKGPIVTVIVTVMLKERKNLIKNLQKQKRRELRRIKLCSEMER